MRARIAAAALVALFGGAAPARAGDPIMPLSQVRAGMHCTGLSVVRGTDIASFDVDVLDVVGGARPSDSRILMRASGPAVDGTGIGSGFSGSPIYCPDSQGTQRNIGAIAEGTNDFGNKVVLAMPIEQILAQPVVGPSGRAVRRAAPARRPLLAPLTVTGLSPPLARAFVAAGKRVGRPVIAVPSSRFAFFGPQFMRPGSAVAAAVSTGAVRVGAVGTVAYTDGDAVWAFGHPIEGTGRRALLLQDAYVYTVINNPTGADQLSSYKLAAPGNDLGTFSNDALDAAVGRVGPLPPRIPVRIEATDGDTGERINTLSQVVDETDVDLPGGTSAVSLIAPVGVEQAALEALRSTPARVSQTMCARIRLRERRKALRICNRYIVDGTVGGVQTEGSTKAKMAQSIQATLAPPGPAEDLAGALSLIDTVTFRRLHVTSVEVSTRLHRGLRQAFILDASARTRVRPGQRVRVTLTTRLVRGPVRRFRFRLRIPRSLPAGPVIVALVGTPSDTAGGGTDESVTTLLAELLRGEPDEEEPEGGDPGPQSVEEVAEQVAEINRFDGVRATFFASPRPGRNRKQEDVPVFRDSHYRISGNGLLLFDVRR